MENTFDKAGNQKNLNKSDQILESVCLIRKDRFDNECLVIYLVPRELTLASATRITSDDFILEILADCSMSADASACLKPSLSLPVRAVLVNAIPRDETGAVDEARLKALPVMDASLITDWSAYLESQKDIDSVAVISALRHRKTAYLHRDDVIQSIDWSPNQADLSPHQNSAEELPDIDASKTKVSSVRAQVQAQGQPFGDRLNDKYSLSLANTLYRATEISPEKGVLYIDKAGKRSFQTYPQLLKIAQIVRVGLEARGIAAGDKVLLQCADNREFLAVFWACILGGMVPVPVSVAPSYVKENAVVQKLLNAWQLFERPLIVCSDSLESNFRDLCKETELCEQQVLFFRQLSLADSALVAQHATEVAPDALTLLLLTSGSTGTPKAVMHTHQTLINRSAATSTLNQFKSADVSLNWMPLDHVGGIVMFHLRDVYNACSQVQVATSWILEQPLRWLDAIDSERASITWAPNFAFALVNDHANEISQRNWDLSCMRFILNAGEAVVARTAGHFLKLLEKDKLPPDSIKPAWGMSETASAVAFSHNFTAKTRADSDGAVEVGNPIPDTSLRIVNADNQVLCEGEKGNLQIKGGSVTPGYYLNPEANQQAFTDDGWFDTGDVGVLNNGCLTITARVKDEIIINGVNYPAAEIETKTESVPGVAVSYTAACAVQRVAGDTDSLAIFFCPRDNNNEPVSELLKIIQETISSSLGVRPEYIIPLSPSHIPKTNIGKIQRSILKQKFEQGEFDEDIKLSERMLGKNVIPDWFYKKQWYPKSISHEVNTLNQANQYLIFCDDKDFGKSLCEKLTSSGVRIVTVSVADKFQIHSKNSYYLNPDIEANYGQLMQALQQVDFYPDVIVHCWTYTELYEVQRSEDLHDAQLLGTYSLLKTLQALSEINATEKPARLYVVSSELQQCLDEDKPLNPYATLLGLLKTVPFEFNWLSVKHIDFPCYRTVAELAVQVDAMFAELCCFSRDDEIVYRGGQRYGWQLTADNLTSDTLSPCPIKRGGIVLITGGLGGVGAYLARFLSSRFDAKLILLGRSVLPAREQWPEVLGQGGKLAERISRYIEIEEMGGEFIYAPVDVTDSEQCREIIGAAEQRWDDELNGIFHLAVGGDIGGRWNDDAAHDIAQETISSYEEMFASKVYASWGLAEIVSRRRSTFMVSFGSVIGIFGAARYASYAAAHTFLSHLTLSNNKKMPGRFYQFDWAVWEDIGLSQQEPAFAADYYRSIGYSLIPASTGMDCLMAGLNHREAELIIGLDADKWPIRQHLPFEAQSMQKLVACFTAEEPHIDVEPLFDEAVASQCLVDRFDVRVGCEFIQLEQIPETINGSSDVVSLHEMIELTTTTDDSKPETAMEKEIASHWSDILDIGSLGKYDSFFQLGGNSLNATQLISRLKQAFNVRLEMRDLFDAATVSKMAVMIENKQEGVDQNDNKVVSDEGKIHSGSLNERELLANLDQLSEEKVAELLSTMQRGEKS